MWTWFNNLSRFQYACLVGCSVVVGVFVADLVFGDINDPSYFAMIGGFIGGFIAGYKNMKCEDDV